MNKNYQEFEDYVYSESVEIHVTCHVKEEAGQPAKTYTLETEVEEEDFQLLLASYRTGKFTNMNQDEKLKVLVAGLDETLRLFEDIPGYPDNNEGVYLDTDVRNNMFHDDTAQVLEAYEFANAVMEVVLEYPDEVKNRKPLTREEIAYYKGETHVVCGDEDYKLVDDIDRIVNAAQFDVFTRQEKREEYQFRNEAEYRLYLALLYDYAALEEM